MVRCSKDQVLIIAPVWNEEKKIGAVVRNIINEAPGDILVVDDGSTDNSAVVALAAGAKVISHQRNLGVGAAIRTGIEYALKNNYQFITIFSGSGKGKARQIPELIKPLRDGNYDMVQGSRYTTGGKGIAMPKHRQLGTKIYTLLFSILVGKRITDGSSGIRAYQTKIFRDRRINLHQDWLNRYELEPYIYFKLVKLGYRIKEVPITIEYIDTKSYTKMRKIIDWWRITRPLIFLALGIKK